MIIEVNEKKIDVPAGSTLKDVLKISKTFFEEGSSIGIIKGTAQKEEATTQYSIITTKGEIKIELDGEASIWHQYRDSFANSRAHWETRSSIAFGPVETGVKPLRTDRKYNRYDIFLGTGGYDPKNSYLIFSRDKHTASYGSPENGLFAKVISGKNVINNIGQGDSILKIEPLMRWETLLDKLMTSDAGTKVEEGMRIFTYFGVKLSPDAPEGAEHFLGLVRKGAFMVDSASSTYLSYDYMIGENCPYEHWDSRNEGSVTIRTDGNGMGRAFIYRQDRTASPVHSVVGNVDKGIELVKLAEANNKLMVRVDPERIMLLGMNFNKAEKLLDERGILLEKKGYLEENAIIVEQEPRTTMEIIKVGRVTATAVHPDKIVKVKLYGDLTPKTTEFFRHSLGLKDKPLGPLPVYYTYEDTFLFKTLVRSEAYKELTPENVPKSVVKAGEIGVTNQAANRYGMIGVKLKDDDMYGPSGEKFECTNMMGKMLDPDKLKDLKSGDTIYVTEVD